MGSQAASTALRTRPADLTTIAKRHSGKFSTSDVEATIVGQGVMMSHGSRDMPIWGPLFSSISQGHEAQVQQRITNLVTYMEGVQAK